MSKHGQPMSQTLAQMHLNELKMNDPKLNKVFDKLKPKATVQLKTSSTIAKGEDFKTYLVVSKNTLRNGVEKITLKNRANPTGVKSFLYRRDGKVTFAIGDMGASIDDIKEKYSLINHEIIEEIEVEELDEDGHTDVASAKNQVKVAMSAMNKMNIELSKLNDEDSLPSWWTNKVAVAVDKLDGMADYLDTQVEEVELDEGKMKQFHMMQTDGKSAEEIAKALKLDLKTVKALMKEEVELDEGKMKQFHMMQTDGKSAEEIAKALKLDLKTVKDLMKEEVEIDEMKMDDPKLVKTFDKLKRGDTVKLKTSSTINKGTDFVDYVVRSKNTVNKGRVEKITLVTKGNEKAVKKFLYKRDGKVTFAIGDMGASIDDIKEGFFSKEYEKGQYKNGDEKPFVDAIKKAGGKNIDVQKPTNRDPMLTIEFDGDVKRAQKEVDKVGDGTEDIDEKLGKNADAGDYIDDFKKSDAPQFKGKSDKKKKDMAIAAYLDAKDKKEEVEKKMDKPDSAKAVDQSRDDKKKTRIAQLQLQIAKATETINKRNTQEKPDA